MLVVTTMLTSLANTLPRSKIKYIDIWLLFCLLIPVMEILLHTVEDHFNRRWVSLLIECQVLKKPFWAN